MLKKIMLLVVIVSYLNAVDLGEININAKNDTSVQEDVFEDVFEEVEYLESTEYIESMPSQKRISKDEAMFIPGVQGDPVKAIQSLSGVTSLGDSSGELFIYASKPEETITTLNHLPIGYLFHMGGLHSVIAPEAIDQIDAYMAGFDVTYGNALGAVINVTPSYPTDEFSGYGHLGLYDASAGINASLSKDVSFYLGVRRSYYDLLLSSIGQATGTLDEDSNTTYTEFPNYYDITFIGQYSPNNNNMFSLELISAQDSLEIASNENAIKDPEAVGNIKSKFGFTTIGARHMSFYNNYESNTLVYYKSQKERTSLFDGYYVDVKDDNIGLFHQSTLEYDKHKLIAGIEVDHFKSPYDLNISVPPAGDNPNFDFTSAEKYHLKETINSTRYSVFLEDIYTYNDSFLVRYGIRYNYTDYNNFGGDFNPRLSFLYKLNEWNNISVSTGVYTQVPTGSKTIEEMGNKNLKYEKAHHYVVHYDNSLYDGVTFNIDGFYKKYFDLAIDDESENYLSEGEGYGYGFDTNIKMKKDDYYLFLAYTYIQSKRDLSTNNQKLYTFYGEVPHTLQVIAGKKLWNNWAISTRLNYHSGTPYTDVIGTYSDNGRIRPLYEDPFSSRLPDYFTLNIKIAQKIKLAKTQSLEWSFEIMNLTNHENISGINYDDNYNKTGYVKQLPLLPWFDLTYRF